MFLLFWASFKQCKKSACYHTDKNSDIVHAATIFPVANTCHSKVYFGINQKNNTVHKNHRGWKNQPMQFMQ